MGRARVLPFIDFKVIRQGTEEALVSNRHQNTPIRVDWTLHFLSRAIEIIIQLVRPGMNVQDTLDAIRFFAHYANS